MIENAAREPEITDLADLLIKMGAEIEGAGTSTIRVRGKETLHGARHTIIPDRIEAGTFLVAGAITNGALELTGCAPEHLASVIAKLRETGVEIRETAPGTLASAARKNWSPPTSAPRNIPASPRTCRRNSWRWPRRPRALR